MSFTNRTLFNILTKDKVLKPGRALDLGCGPGKDADALARNGYVVDAVDGNPEAIKLIVASSTLFPIVSKIEDYKIKENSYHLVSCQYVLHFLPKKTANEIISRMVLGAVSGGVISFNLLGEKDEWKNKWTTWTRGEAEELISSLPVTIHKIITEEGSGMTKAETMKYWHVLNFVIIKN